MPTHSYIHVDGWKFIGVFALVALLLFIIHPLLGSIGILLTAWCIYFFRNPERVTPIRPGLIISPADGKIVAIKEVQPPKDFDMGDGLRTRVRIPIGGVIRKAIYYPGKFFNASLDKASEYNERNALVIEIDDKHDLGVVQIAGLIARRIRSDVKEDEAVLTGQRYGLIRFGSRTDIYLPKNVKPLVVEGQTMLAGETVLADLHSKEERREGDYR
jgi:phosphatidylserine decarboxylase